MSRERVVLRIETIVAGGDGLGRAPDGRVVFVPRTGPGELVEAELVETHRQWARARATGVLDPSPDRRDAPCPHYDRCGGCQIQHLGYPAQIQAKSAIIADALQRLGGFEEVDLPPIFADPEREFGYRNRITLTLRRVGMRVYAGYHGWDDPGRIVDVEACPLAEDPINAVWARLRERWGPGADRLPAGSELRLTLRATGAGQVGLVIEAGRGTSLSADRGEPEALVAEIDGLDAIWAVDGSGGVLWGAGAEALEDRWGPHALRVAGAAFVQVNRALAAEMERYALERCGDVEARRVIDAYCGYGVRSIELARAGAEVVGIDLDPLAVEAASESARAADVKARFVRAPVEEALETELPADRVVLNPPRRGIEESVAEALRARPPERIVYVSCDPATLARDLARLSPRFRIQDLCGFDLFPQTAHVETVATLMEGEHDE